MQVHEVCVRSKPLNHNYLRFIWIKKSSLVTGSDICLVILYYLVHNKITFALCLKLNSLVVTIQAVWCHQCWYRFNFVVPH
ncbi:CLUMA_CG014600, isoform A [Clunio marinus]|uniref:CLUMA_CG014600, isoform A n=1 Tax=Clunio marinus TaxID=568069 RepID=A0A1J1IN27_9DIPT|nr:CLUMA_CG014600, isoform A [Clunio marinus]